MSITTSKRHQIAAKILQSFSTRHAGNLRVTGLQGERPMMVAFADELISDVFERISWTGGFSNLFVVKDDSIAVVAVLPAESAISEGESLAAAEIHQDASIGMLVEVSRAYSEGLRIPVRLANIGGDVLAGAELVPQAA